ncbi:hypothetical protein GW934_02520, partial [Candidatus Falkowbacteria bacterium]|nr:hypothetical protein [Candidatus Falkowbacteria bacterium]
LDEALKPLFSGDKPLVLVLGGGTGAIAINKLVQDSKSELLNHCHLIHVTGRNKGNLENETNPEAGKGIYLSWEFLSHSQLLAIMDKATLVV